MPSGACASSGCSATSVRLGQVCAEVRHALAQTRRVPKEVEECSVSLNPTLFKGEIRKMGHLLGTLCVAPTCVIVCEGVACVGPSVSPWPTGFSPRLGRRLFRFVARAEVFAAAQRFSILAWLQALPRPVSTSFCLIGLWCDSTRGCS